MKLGKFFYLILTKAWFTVLGSFLTIQMLTHYFSCLESPQLWSLSPRAWTDSSGFHNYQIIAVTNSQQNTHHLDLRPNTEDWSLFQSSVSSLPLASQASLVAACSSTLTRSLSLPRFWSTWYYQHTVYFSHDKINLIIMIKFRSSTRTRRRCTRSPAPSPPSWRTPWPPPPGSRQEEGVDDYDEDDDDGVEDADDHINHQTQDSDLCSGAGALPRHPLLLTLFGWYQRVRSESYLDYQSVYL